MSKVYIPALRGLFGDWIYYSCLMPIKLVAERINYAEELHENKELSKLIQRELKVGRSIEIAEYLHVEKERFFNSMVVAVYGGKPRWYEVGVEAQDDRISIDEIPDYALHSIGLLHLSGDERLFALDGQHRLAGMKRAIEEGANIEDEVSVLLVAHNNTQKGLQRTRRLFTTLNKTAVPVNKGERIALDENDVMAIVTRRLVEDNPKFSGQRIAYNATTNLTSTDTESLTTIGNLYDLLGILYAKILKIGELKDLQYRRPSDKDLDEYYESACHFFDSLQDRIPELREFFESADTSPVVAKHRGSFGGSIVFRPIGLSILVEIIAALAKEYELKSCLDYVAELPRELSGIPYANVIWDTRSNVVVNKRKVLARNLLLYMLGEVNNEAKLKKDYAAALGVEVEAVKLPEQIYSS